VIQNEDDEEEVSKHLPGRQRLYGAKPWRDLSRLSKSGDGHLRRRQLSE
jgi:hypothetical protein